MFWAGNVFYDSINFGKYFCDSTNFGNISVTRRTSPFHHWKMNSPFHHWKMENNNSPFNHKKRKRSIHHFTIEKWKRVYHHFRSWATDTRNGFLRGNGKGHVPDDPDPDSSLADSSSKKKKRNKKKKCCKHRKDDSSDPSSNNDYDSSEESDYRRKRRRRKSDRKKDPIKLYAHLRENFPTSAYKSKIIRFKMDEDLLQWRIYFLPFVESLEMIFSQYTETC